MTEENEEEWNGKTDRRFCEAHCSISKAAKNSVPRWIYISTIAAAVTLAGVFATIQRTSFNDFEDHISEKIKSGTERFYKSAEANGIILQGMCGELREIRAKQTDIQVNLGKIESKQDIVMQKVKLTE